MNEAYSLEPENASSVVQQIETIQEVLEMVEPVCREFERVKKNILDDMDVVQLVVDQKNYDKNNEAGVVVESTLMVQHIDLPEQKVEECIPVHHLFERHNESDILAPEPVLFNISDVGFLQSDISSVGLDNFSKVIELRDIHLDTELFKENAVVPLIDIPEQTVNDFSMIDSYSDVVEFDCLQKSVLMNNLKSNSNGFERYEKVLNIENSKSIEVNFDGIQNDFDILTNIYSYPDDLKLNSHFNSEQDDRSSVYKNIINGLSGVSKNNVKDQDKSICSKTKLGSNSEYFSDSDESFYKPSCLQFHCLDDKNSYLKSVLIDSQQLTLPYSRKLASLDTSFNSEINSCGSELPDESHSDDERHFSASKLSPLHKFSEQYFNFHHPTPKDQACQNNVVQKILENVNLVKIDLNMNSSNMPSFEVTNSSVIVNQLNNVEIFNNEKNSNTINHLSSIQKIEVSKAKDVFWNSDAKNDIQIDNIAVQASKKNVDNFIQLPLSSDKSNKSDLPMINTNKNVLKDEVSNDLSNFGLSSVTKNSNLLMEPDKVSPKFKSFEVENSSIIISQLNHECFHHENETTPKNKSSNSKPHSVDDIIPYPKSNMNDFIDLPKSNAKSTNSNKTIFSYLPWFGKKNSESRSIPAIKEEIPHDLSNFGLSSVTENSNFLLEPNESAVNSPEFKSKEDQNRNLENDCVNIFSINNAEKFVNKWNNGLYFDDFGVFREFNKDTRRSEISSLSLAKGFLNENNILSPETLGLVGVAFGGFAVLLRSFF